MLKTRYAKSQVCEKSGMLNIRYAKNHVRSKVGPVPLIASQKTVEKREIRGWLEKLYERGFRVVKSGIQGKT